MKSWARSCKSKYQHFLDRSVKLWFDTIEAMEENSQNQPQVAQSMAPRSDVGFPQPHEAPSGRSKVIKWVIALVGILVIVGIGGWFILQDVGDQNATPSPTPDGGLSTFPTPETSQTPEVSATPTSEPVQKADVKIEVLNGTGTPGDAGFLEKELKALGFSQIETGNADEQKETATTVTFTRELAAPIVDEITSKLKELYNDVTSRKGTLPEDLDVRVVTGVKKGSSTTTKATASPKPVTSATGSPSASPTASPSPTPTT